MTRNGNQASGLVAVLDIGTSKTVCLIAVPTSKRSAFDDRLRAQGTLRVVGVGHQPSRGIKAGVVIDLAEAEACVRATIAQAERMAGVTLTQIHVSISCGRLASHHVTASAELAGSYVTGRDLARLNSGARAYVERDGRRLIQLNRRLVQLDGVANDGDLIGLAAHTVTAGIHAVSADEAPIHNVLMVLERCHVRVAGLMAAPFASALAATTEEERQIGITVLDIGAGTIKLAAFSSGKLEFVRSLPMGSALISADIARALHTPIIEAERIKVLYGNLLSARSDEHEGFSYPTAGADEGSIEHATRAQLAQVIRPRCAEILRAVAIEADGRRFKGGAGDELVLSGGGSLLNGMAEFASDLLQRPVRKGHAPEVPGLPPVARTPGFSTVTGSLLASKAELAIDRDTSDAGHDGYIQRVGAWLKSGF